MIKDINLEKKIEDFILSQGRYVKSEEILNFLNISGGRIYLSYRGINVTEINRRLGFVRRQPVVYKQKFNIKYKSKESVEEKVRSIITKLNRYVSISEISRKHGLSEWVVRKFSVDVHYINSQLGFVKKSPMSKFYDIDFSNKIEQLILEKNRYLTQLEIAKHFGISVAYITQSNIDTVLINHQLGYNRVYEYGELIAIKYLVKNEVTNLVRQKTFNNCKSEKGFLLKFDIYLPESNSVIEIDGPQHYEREHKFYSEYLVSSDRMKEKFCKDSNIFLLRIPIKDKYQIDKIIKHAILENLERLLNHNITENSRCDGQKLEVLDNQQPSLCKMRKVQRASRKGVATEG